MISTVQVIDQETVGKSWTRETDNKQCNKLRGHSLIKECLAYTIDTAMLKHCFFVHNFPFNVEN